MTTMQPKKIVRDNASKAVLNTDVDALAQYRSKREKAKEAKTVAEDVKEIRGIVSTIQDDVSELKDLIHGFLAKMDSNG